MPEAIVIGAGPNGLVAANNLIDQGWDVTLLEASDEVGGAVRSSELMEPGFINDHFSAFYPLGAGSPAIKALSLEHYGLVWKQAPLVLAHPASDDTCPVISRDLLETMTSLDELGAGDGEAWRKLFVLWESQGANVIDALFTSFPPVKAGLRMATSLGWKDLLRFARFGVVPVRDLGEELFSSGSARRLMAGMALHGDLLPESNLSGFFGWLLAMLGQDVGWPVPEGGAGNLALAMRRRFESRGGVVHCNQRVTEIVVRANRAVGVKTATGDDFRAASILADIDAPRLFLDLLPNGSLPPDVYKDIKKFRWDHSTVKVDWNLDTPVPWRAEPARRAGTVHLTEGVDELSVTASELAQGLIPARPFVLLGQQSMTDPTRAPAGKDAVWAYTHVPVNIRGDGKGELSGPWDAEQTQRFVERMEDEVEALAPGFKDSIRTRHVQSPDGLEHANPSLRHGAINGGTSQLHQQLVFRPIPGLARPETPIEGLYLASSSAHPSGGVHGAAGANAARAAVLGHKHPKVVGIIRRAGRVRKVDRKPSIIP